MLDENKNFFEFIEHLTEPLLLQSYAVVFFVSLILCLVIILSSGYGFNRRGAYDESAVQSAHSGFVPRVGGLAIFISILSLIPLLSFGLIPLSLVFDLNASEVALLLLSATPIFFAGVAEDLGYAMSPRLRLFASFVASFLAVTIFGVWLSGLGILWIDQLLIFAPLGIGFTLFATVGVVNAFNLIDGLNGLSSYVSVSIALSLSLIAFQVGVMQFAIFLLFILAAVLGFMVLNFPFGKIFLGDGGAYFLGHILVWCSILLINQNSEISPFAILLIFFWPVADTGLAIWRRWKLGNPADHPDRLHFHQLVMRFLEIRFFGRDKRHISNPVSTIFLMPFISTPQIFGVLFWNDFIETVWSTFLMSLVFVSTYVLGIKLAKKSYNLKR